MFKKNKKEEKKLVLKTAQERYVEAAGPQLQNYMHEIEESTARGGEKAFILFDSEYPIRAEHVRLLISNGYDLYLKKREDMILPGRSPTPHLYGPLQWKQKASFLLPKNYLAKQI